MIQLEIEVFRSVLLTSYGILLIRIPTYEFVNEVTTLEELAVRRKKRQKNNNQEE